MFEIGFWELLFLALIGLLVVGPKRLPALARTLGDWAGRLKMMMRQVRADIERELHADEMREKAQELEKEVDELKRERPDERR